MINNNDSGLSTRAALNAMLDGHISVKDPTYGAVGDGAQDDTAAIQACFDAAYGSHANPGISNKAVFFPAGHYRVTRPVYIMDTGGAYVYGAGEYATIIKNDGSVPGAVFTASIAASVGGMASVMTVTNTNVALYIGNIFSGNLVNPGSVVAKQLTGSPGGTGTYVVSRHDSPVPSTTMTAENKSTFYLNGVAYSTFRDFAVASASGTAGVAFEYDWAQYPGNNWAAQLNHFEHMIFAGGDIGCRAGISQAQCDTSTWLNCYFAGNGTTTTGLKIQNLNCIAHNIYGGNISGCDYGIRVIAGGFGVISGVGFQHQGSWDISIEGGAQDATQIEGCSTESVNFVSNRTGAVQIALSACSQRTGVDGTFFSGGGGGNQGGGYFISGCTSRRGKIIAGNPGVVSACRFNRFDAFGAWYGGQNGTLKIEHTTLGNCLNRYITKQIFKSGTPFGIRTYDLEAASLSDVNFLYASIEYGSGTGTLSQPTTVTSTSPGVFTFGVGADAEHFFAADQPIAFTATGSMPTGVTASKTYYVKTILDANRFTISATVGGAAINTSSAGSGVRTYIPRTLAAGDHVLNTVVAAGGSPGWVCTTAGNSLPEVGGGSAAVFKAMANIAA